MIDLKRVRQLFDARRPGYSLPQEFYTDPEIFEFDVEAIHSRCWLFVGLEAEIPLPGSYLAMSIGRSPIVVVRDQNGEVRAFYNTCRHRGAQICETGRGRNMRLVCPYHQWTYRLDGSLQGAGWMHEGFDPKGIHLVPIHVETVAGTVYVCLADEPPPFEDFKEKVAPLLAPNRLVDAKLAYETTMVARANWKLVMENGTECYHCPVGHPSLIASAYPWGTRRDIERSVLAGREFAARMAAAGVPMGQTPGELPGFVRGDWWRAHRFPLKEGCISLTMDGKPSVAKQLCEIEGGDVGDFRWALQAHSFGHALCDYVITYSALPSAVQETIITWKMFVHKDAQEGVDYNLDEFTTLWANTNREDRDLAELNQRGVNGKGYRPGPYSQAAEPMLIRFVDWYCAESRKYLDSAAASRAAVA